MHIPTAENTLIIALLTLQPRAVNTLRAVPKTWHPRPNLGSPLRRHKVITITTTQRCYRRIHHQCRWINHHHRDAADGLLAQYPTGNQTPTKHTVNVHQCIHAEGIFAKTPLAPVHQPRRAPLCPDTQTVPLGMPIPERQKLRTRRLTRKHRYIWTAPLRKLIPTTTRLQKGIQECVIRRTTTL